MAATLSNGSPMDLQPKTQKRKSSKPENNNNSKKLRLSSSICPKDDMLETYQPWVIKTYGDLAKTKTITLNKYARIIRTLRGEEPTNADNSKFRFWVRAKGFHEGVPIGYDAKPADGIIGRFSVCDLDKGISPEMDKIGSARDPPLYVPNQPFKNGSDERPVYRKVAVVENFFDIIYSVHVELEGRPGKHAGQKRTYRTITETYAFLPREAVTRFLLGCTECQRRPRSPSPAKSLSVTMPPLPAPVPASLPPIQHLNQPQIQGSKVDSSESFNSFQENETIQTSLENSPIRSSTPQIKNPDKKSSNPLDVSNLTSPITPPKKRHSSYLIEKQDDPSPTQVKKIWSPIGEDIKSEEKKKNEVNFGEIDYSLPITTTYLKYMRSLGCTDEDALKFEKLKVHLTPEVQLDNREEAKDPEDLYKRIEHNMKLSRLEEPATLTVALRHLVRRLHPKGNQITFPIPEAVDKIQLRCSNLPSEVEELKPLVEEIFTRREEPLNFDELYKDFVMSHGRIAVDLSMPWPLCFMHTRHP